MKKNISILFIFVFLQVFSQKEDLKDQVLISFDITSLKISYEKVISNKITSNLGLGIGAGYYNVDNNVNHKIGMSIVNIPIVVSQNNKYYYNREKRQNDNKSIENNSGNYIGLKFRFNTGTESTDLSPHNSLLSEINWGLQRDLGHNWIFNFSIGIGYLSDFDTNNQNIIPTIGLLFGYNFL